jgi:quercetin dioxygenase-like cupin family protein
MDYFFSPALLKEVEVPKQGILSRTLHNDDHVKVVIFGFSPGQELSAHTAPYPADLFFLEGEGRLTLGSDKMAVQAGSFAHMSANLSHAIVATTPLVMALVMMKGLHPSTQTAPTPGP